MYPRHYPNLSSNDLLLKACDTGAEEAAQAGLVSRLVPEDMVDAEVGIKLQTAYFPFM